jgi:hypothetical protein
MGDDSTRGRDPSDREMTSTVSTPGARALGTKLILAVAPFLVLLLFLLLEWRLRP